MSNEVSVLLSFKKDTNALTEAEKQVNGFIRTLQEGMKLDFGFRLADALLEIPGKFREITAAALEYGESVKNMSVETRTSSADFQVLSAMANEAGIDVNKLVGAVQQMSLHASEAVNGNKALAGAFADLHINAQEFSALSVPEQLEALAKAAANAGWSTGALNDLSQILGTRNLPALMVILHKLADEGFKEYADAATKAGEVASDSVIGSLAKIAEAHKQTAQKWKVTWSEMTDAMAPALIAIDRVSSFMAGVGSFVTRQLNPSSVVDRYNAAHAGGNKASTGNGGAVKSVETIDRETAATAKLVEENDKLVAKLRELQDAQMAPEAKLAQLKTELEAAKAAERAAGAVPLAAGQNDALAQNAAFLKLSVARQELEVKVETAQKEADRAAKETKNAAERLTNLQQESRLKIAMAAVEVEEIAAKEKQSEIEKSRRLIESNAALGAQDKAAQLATNAEQYRAIVAQIVTLEEKRAALAKDPVEVARLLAEIAQLKSGAANYGAKEAGKDKSNQTISGAGKAGLEDILQRSGSVASNLRSSINGIAQSLTGSIASGIEGLINRTETWSQALRKIGSTVLSSIVGAFARMVAEYTVSRATMFLINKVYGVAEAGTQAAQATAAAALWAPAAIAASIASFGSADAAGLAAYASAIAAGSGMTAAAGIPGFSAGGPTGNGGIVHAGEWVAPAWMVNHPILGQTVAALEAMRTSSTPSLAGSGLGSAGGGGGRTNVMFMDDRQSALAAMRRTQGQTRVVQIMRNGRGEFFA